MILKIIATDSAKIISEGIMLDNVYAKIILTYYNDDTFIRLSVETFNENGQILSNINSFFWNIENNINKIRIEIFEPDFIDDYCTSVVIEKLENIGYIIRSI